MVKFALIEVKSVESVLLPRIYLLRTRAKHATGVALASVLVYASAARNGWRVEAERPVLDRRGTQASTRR